MFLKIERRIPYCEETKVVGKLILKEKSKGAINKWLPYRIEISGDIKNLLDDMDFFLQFKRKIQGRYGLSIMKGCTLPEELKIFNLFKNDFSIEVLPLEKKVIKLSFRKKGEYVERNKFVLSDEIEKLVEKNPPGFYEVKFLSPVIELFFKKGNNESWRKKVDEMKQSGFRGTLILDITSRMHFGNEYRMIHFSEPKVLIQKIT